MRVKTSVTLPKALLKRIKRVDPNRSAFLERASLEYLAKIERKRREDRDLEIINANLDYLNAEALDVLEYQRIP
jgi:metal-responsive CopG/Arc/MetJ family transcriptional regulator